MVDVVDALSAQRAACEERVVDGAVCLSEDLDMSEHAGGVGPVDELVFMRHAHRHLCQRVDLTRQVEHSVHRAVGIVVTHNDARCLVCLFLHDASCQRCVLVGIDKLPLHVDEVVALR